jgi:hypothetical protein
MVLYVVRVDGVEGVDSRGMKTWLRSAAGGGYELITSVEGKELRISVKEACIEAYGPRRY